MKEQHEQISSTKIKGAQTRAKNVEEIVKNNGSVPNSR